MSIAQAAYVNRAADIARHIAFIQQQLAAHAARQAADPSNWDYVDELNEAEAKLAEVVEFLS